MHLDIDVGAVGRAGRAGIDLERRHEPQPSRHGELELPADEHLVGVEVITDARTDRRGRRTAAGGTTATALSLGARREQRERQQRGAARGKHPGQGCLLVEVTQVIGAQARERKGVLHCGAVSLLELQGVTKHYPGVTALDGVDFAVAAGTVHAVVGENGAGKSTLLRLIAGADVPDAGTIRWDGAPVHFASPRDALRRGITVIYQELALVPNLGADANIFLGIEPTRRGVLDQTNMTECAAEALHELGLFIDPREPVGRLSVARQQLVELARALVRDARLVAMDEPTAALTAHEVAHLVAQIERLRETGISVIFVSHRLDEVRRVANTVTVLRDGHRVWVGPAAGLDEAALVRRMVGRDVAYERRPPARPPETTPLLEVTGLSQGTAFRDVSLTLARGEIVGLAGLVGAGRTALARAIAGIDPWDSGTARLAGRDYRPRHPRDAIARGVVYLPEDRKRDGLVLGMRVRENVTLPVLHRFTRTGRVTAAAE